MKDKKWIPVLDFFLGVGISLFWTLSFIDAMAPIGSISEFRAGVIYFIINATSSFIISKFTSFKTFAYTFFCVTFLLNFFVFALIGSVRWF